MSTKKDNEVKLESAIETLAQELETDTVVFAGVKAFKGWTTGKVVTKEEYEKAIKEFLGAPLGKEVKK